MLKSWKSMKKFWSNKMLSLSNKKSRKSMSEESLPDDLIEEILSWLPVKSAVRFYSVCKLFRTIIQDQKFIEKHMLHAKIDTTVYLESSNAPFLVMCRSNGLVLEQCNPSGICQVRNHATNWSLELPSSEDGVVLGDLCHIAHTNEYKVLFVSWTGASGIGMKVLIPGSDIAWRPIEIPVSLDRDKNVVISRSPPGLFTYIVEFSKPDLKQSKMIAFNIEDESFMEISMPREVLFFNESEFWAIQWEKTISLICRVENGYRVWLLDDGERSKWIEKSLVYQTHATGQDEDHSIFELVQPVYALQGWLYCQFGHEPLEVIFNITSMDVIHKGPRLPRIADNLNSLVSFREMH